MTVELDSKAQWLESPIRIMNHIIPVGIMMDIITGVAIGIIPTFLVVITGAPAILGIIGKIYPDNDESQVRCPCSKNKGLDKGKIRWT